MRHLVMQNNSLPPPLPLSNDGNSQPPLTPMTPDINQTESNITIATDSQDSNLVEFEFPQKKRGGWPKGRKRRRCPRDANAPKQPLTGYICYLNENREKVKLDNSGASFSQVTKLLAIEWGKLGSEEKQKYIEEADKDKERYMKELEQYRQTEAYSIFKKEKEMRRKDFAAEAGGSTCYNSTALDDINQSSPEDGEPKCGIPIFTEEFLNHNKVRELELQHLVESNAEYEEQNAILIEDIENVHAAIENLEIEAVHLRNNNCALKDHVSNFRKTLFKHFANIPLPGSNELPTFETIDSYMIKMHSILQHPQENEALIAQVQDILKKVDYP